MLPKDRLERMFFFFFAFMTLMVTVLGAVDPDRKVVLSFDEAREHN